MNQMNVGGMHPGNPAMGGMPMMNNGANGIQYRPQEELEDQKYESRLNCYIYGYFLEKGMFDSARAFLKEGGPHFEPALKHDDNLNGADEKPETKDGVAFKKPGDLPRAPSTKDEQGGPFLLSWFELFWDVYWAQRKNNRATQMASNFVQLSQAQARRNDQQQQQILRAMPNMMPAGMDYQNQLMRQNQMIGMANGDLRQAALRNNRMGPNNPQMAQFLQQRQVQQQQLLQNQMRRDGSEMNGQRPRTPSGTDHAPSPSKRQRLDGVPFNGQQMMQNGRAVGPGMPGQQMMADSPAGPTNALLMSNGINPANLSEAQYQSFQQQPPQIQQKSIQVYAQNMSKHQRDMSKAGGMSDQDSPMIPPGVDLSGAAADLFATNPAAALQLQRNGVMPPQPGANGAGGNHALQDYQMQLMLLEQQNKKRLLMARQEQDSITRPEQQPGMPGQAGFPQGMSPGSRGGASPQPDPTRRGTPKMGQPGMDGSPMPTGSPAPMNFNNMDAAQLYSQMNGRMQPPPSSNPAFNGQFHQMEAMQRAQQAGGNRIPNGNWPQGPPGQAPMVPQNQPPQPPQMGTPQQRTEMPPPQAVPAANAANGRTSSPTPPTPQQTNKANPKKKEKNDRKKPTKKNSTTNVAATPASEPENPAATPTSSTPITPSHPNSFNPKTEGPNPTNSMPNASSNPTPQIAPPQQDANPSAPFSNVEATDVRTNLPASVLAADKNAVEQGGDFAFSNDLNDPNVLEHFDFDQFLQGDAFAFDTSMYENESLEAAGMGE